MFLLCSFNSLCLWPPLMDHSPFCAFVMLPLLLLLSLLLLSLLRLSLGPCSLPCLSLPSRFTSLPRLSPLSLYYSLPLLLCSSRFCCCCSRVSAAAAPASLLLLLLPPFALVALLLYSAFSPRPSLSSLLLFTPSFRSRRTPYVTTQPLFFQTRSVTLLLTSRLSYHS